MIYRCWNISCICLPSGGVAPILGLYSQTGDPISHNSSLPTFLFRQNNDVLRIRSRDKIPLIKRKYTVQCNCTFFKDAYLTSISNKLTNRVKSFKKIEYFDIFQLIKEHQNPPTIHNLLICNLYMNS